MSRRNIVVDNSGPFPSMESLGQIYARDMVEGVPYIVCSSSAEVTLINGRHHYVNILGYEFLGQPSDFTILRKKA